MPAVVELAIAKACNRVLQTSYLLPFISLYTVAAASIQIVLDFTTEHTQVWFTNCTALEPSGICSLEPLILSSLCFVAALCFVSHCFHCSARIS